MQTYALSNAAHLGMVENSTPVDATSFPRCVYVSGGELYYNDDATNQVAITSGGAVVGAPGNISGMTGGASVSFNSGTGTYTFLRAASTPGSLDAGSVTIRETVSSGNGVTIQAPTGLASGYSLTLPGALPSATRFMRMTSAGAISASVDVDNSTLEVDDRLILDPRYVIRVKDLGVTTAKINTGAVTQAKLGAVVDTSATISATAQTSADGVVELASMTLTTYGRPILIEGMTTPSTSFATPGEFELATTGTGQALVYAIVDSATFVGSTRLYTNSQINLPVSTFRGQLSVTAGSHTIKVYAVVTTSNTILNIDQATVHVREL
jgi:hypothetical protein